jgi:alpha-L-rhamnosidase
MKRIITSLFFLCTTLSLSALNPNIQVLKLKCDFKENPLGIESTRPSLSWQLQSSQREQNQSAYRILVADQLQLLDKNLGNIWDSGKQVSNKSIQIEYAGKSLQSAQKYYWKVMVWDAKGKASAWSTAAHWQMGLLAEKDWSGASWIALEKIAEGDKILPALHATKAPNKPKSALPQFRKEYAISKTIKQATGFVAGLGHFEFFINGQKVGKNFLDPGWTNYQQTAQYVTFDLTQLLVPGKNAFGVMLGNGFYHIPNERYWKILQSYGYPTCKLKILIEYSDGSSEQIITDQSWKCTRSPITYSSIYGGEDYDATLEQKGWKLPGFDDAHWQTPLVLSENMPSLRTQSQEPLGYFEEFTPQKISSPKPGIWVYDLAQNFSGIFQIQVQGQRGRSIKISPAELLHDDGSVNQSAIGEPVFFNYTLSGEGLESWQPQFMYYGFRYVQIEGAVPEGQSNPDNLPVIKGLKGIHTRNAAAKIGDFSCSNPLFNRVYTLIDWAIRSNMASVLTDCPHREKLGWLEEAYLMGPSLRYNYDLATLYPKILEDMRASQLPNGLIPDIAPEYVPFQGGFRDSPEWGSAGVIIPWEMYQWYGNVAVLQENYAMMKRYVDYLSSRADQHIVAHGLGDWFDYGPKQPGEAQLTSKALSATAIYYYDISIVQKVAFLLGNRVDAAKYQTLGEAVKKAFNARFFDPIKMQYEKGSQTAYAMPLELGLVEPQHRAAVLTSLLNSIQANNYALTAGDIGFHYLVSALQNGGASEVIYKMNSRDDVPGYGFQLAKGATALTESWPALKNVSNNHFMLGHLMEWFFNGLGGIKPSESVLAFKEFVIRPEMVGDLTEAKVDFESMYGPIQSHWKKTAQGIEMNVEIPVNTQALVYFPTQSRDKILEAGKKVNYKVLKGEGGRTVLRLGSGKYSFLIQP